MRAIHFICRRDDQGRFRNLSFDKTTRTYRSGNWNVSDEQAGSLVNGWLYLHPTKASPSEFGGRIIGFEHVIDDEVARQDRIVFLVQKQLPGTGQSWRGKNHGMAYTSGIISADLPHETQTATVYPPESDLRDEMTRLAKSLYDRGFSVGSAGNISARTEDGVLITPTNSCLGFLDPARISKLDTDWRHVSGDKPSKEVFLHRAFYDTRPGTGAVVHLHSTYATALSCLADTDPGDCLPPLTPYVVMRVGRVKLVPYFRPGDEAGGALIRALGGQYAAVLLANHGPEVSGADLAATVYAAEELEETAKLLVLLRGAPVRMLEPASVAELLRA